MEWNEQRRYLDQVEGRSPGRSTEEKGREEGEEDKGSGERQIRNEIIKEVIRSSQKIALEESCKNEGKRTGGQKNTMQSWDWSQIENEEEEESWQEGDKMAEQWEEEQHLEEIV